MAIVRKSLRQIRLDRPALDRAKVSDLCGIHLRGLVLPAERSHGIDDDPARPRMTSTFAPFAGEREKGSQIGSRFELLIWRRDTRRAKIIS